MKLVKNGPEQYVTEDGLYKIHRDFELTECECPEWLCKHSDGVREEYHWYIFPNTEAGERMGLPDSLGSGDTLKDVRRALERIYFKRSK